MAPAPSIIAKIVAKYGVPERVYVDNGRAFSSKAFRDGMAALGIEVHFGSPYSARAKRLERNFVDLTEVNLDELGGG